MDKDEFIRWKNDPVTLEYFKILNRMREDIKEGWARGIYTSETLEGTAQLNAEAFGRVAQLSTILEIDNNSFED